MAEAARGGGGIHQVGGYDAPQSVRDATASWAPSYVPKRGRPTKRGHEVVVVESEEGPPPTPKGKAPTPSPKPSKVAKVPPPPPALDVGALAASVATHVTDACQTSVEQAAATGVEAALAKGRAADHKSALSRAEKVQGNTQRALDRALDLANKRGEELEAVRGDLRARGPGGEAEGRGGGGPAKSGGGGAAEVGGRPAAAPGGG